MSRYGHPRPYKVRVLRQWSQDHHLWPGKWYPTKGCPSYEDQATAVERAREIAAAGHRVWVYYGYPAQPGVIAGGRYTLNESFAAQFPVPEWVVVTINPDGTEEWEEAGTTEERLFT